MARVRSAIPYIFLFHEDCLEVWVKNNVTFPNCRASLVRVCGKGGGEGI